MIVNHFKSYNGIDDEKDGDRVRQKRRLEAEWLANFVEDRQKADPTERIILCGDFNAFQFNDGYNDLIGILKGKSDQNVLAPSKTVFATGLVADDRLYRCRKIAIHTASTDRHRLSIIFWSTSRTIAGVKIWLLHVPMPIFRTVYANDATRPERTSDHDAPVVFLYLDEPAPPQLDRNSETVVRQTPSLVSDRLSVLCECSVPSALNSCFVISTQSAPDRRGGRCEKLRSRS